MNALLVVAAVVGAALVGALAVGYRRGNTPAVVNTAAVLCLTLLPPAAGWLFGDGPATAGLPSLTFATAVAGFLHALGMLGRYESVGWWDHLTHTISAALLAALLYAGLLVLAPSIAAAGALLGTLALGVLWEVGELIAREVAERYDIEPVLVHYGRRDTALDLVFDAVGAGLVVVLDLRLFHPVAEWAVRASGIA
ncbi:hypothetical protein B4589_006360 [Halolamina sp. CBA1230]|uniref:hypothetical protein n=1 Tax=Halolamina sp. CBA1230 TaxID=1853690 RepID=UPI0009A176DA|nr:hypothetical protein [Halolamina sp. CBA1230]QKY20018.1 hypothetical protein B4589_006360 [Halolamina sp. CBA1230]